MALLKHYIPKRTYTGNKWTTNTTNKKHLARDFSNRCAYCDDHHSHFGGYKNYHVEHFAPKERFPTLKNAYDNLLYACPFCNWAKSDTWVSDSPNVSVIDDEGFIDPCDLEYYNHLGRKEDGSIFPKTKLGNYMYKNLKLYLNRHRIAYNLEIVNNKIERLESKIEKERLKGDSRETKVLSELYKYFHEYTKLLREDDESNN
jgi:hypothetical protein